MATHQSKAQKETVSRVMHEFKHGELESSSGRKVRNPKQAIAIGLHEAGASKYESKKKNRENLKRTKARERHGATEKASCRKYPRWQRNIVAGKASNVLECLAALPPRRALPAAARHRIARSDPLR
jgi:hypothetical protein